MESDVEVDISGRPALLQVLRECTSQDHIHPFRYLQREGLPQADRQAWPRSHLARIIFSLARRA